MKEINRGVGRPKKAINDKENPVDVRLSPRFLLALKEVALAQKKPWQTLVKEILAKEIGYKAEDNG
jgi:predicted DNA binding CopG/RHH family protein